MSYNEWKDKWFNEVVNWSLQLGPKWMISESLAKYFNYTT